MAQFVVTLVDGVKHQFEAESWTFVDDLEYDGSTHRDIITSADMGRAALGVDVRFIQSGGLFGSLLDMPDSNTKGIGQLGDTIQVTQLEDAKFEQSDVFTHTPPRPTEKTKTYAVFWSGAGGTGNQVAFFPKNRITGCSIGTATYV